MNIEEIGGYSDKPKSDPHGQTRIAPTRTMPIRAFGESECRRPPPSVTLVLAPRLKRLLRYGSRSVKLAIKRVRRAECKRFGIEEPVASGAFLHYSRLKAFNGKVAPIGLPIHLLMKEFMAMSGRRDYTPADSPFGWGLSFYYKLSDIMVQDILERNNDPERHRKMVKEILEQENKE